MCVYLSCISLLLQAVNALLQRAVGSLMLLQRRPQLLLQTMTLARELAHLDLNANTHTHTSWFDPGRTDMLIHKTIHFFPKGIAEKLFFYYLCHLDVFQLLLISLQLSFQRGLQNHKGAFLHVSTHTHKNKQTRQHTHTHE